MSKYNEIMGRLIVTDEMQSRILNNVEMYFASKKTSKRRAWYMAFGGIAVAAMLMLVIRPWSLKMPIPVEQDSPAVQQGIFENEEFSSAKELSDKTGFNIYDITKLPFEAKEKTYMTIGEELAEIIYTGEDNRLIYRMSVGEDDNSGDYTVYENINEIKVSGLTVTLKGKKGLVNLAIWSDGKYAYSLSVDEAIKDEEMTAIIYEIISK